MKPIDTTGSQTGQAYRVAAIASHPIQYQTPLFRALAARPEIDLTVFFCSEEGLRSYRDEGFGQEVKWDIPLLGGYRYEFLPNISPRPRPSSFWGLINPRIVSRLRTGEFDALWIHGWARFTNWLAMFTAFASGIPVLLRGETNLLPSLPGWKRVLKRIILQRLFRRVSAFLAIGRYNKEFYEAYAVPKDRIFLAPYAVDNEFFLTRSKELVPKKSELKRALSIPDNLTVILFVGKLTQAKRPMDLLMAYETLSKHTEATLLYVGDGPLRSALESYVKIAGLKNVYFVGFKNQTELPSFYALADIFVLPSSLEPWGLVVNEVMIAGKPIIVSDHVGCGPDLVQDSVNGFIVPVGDIAALAERLRLLVSNPYLATQMGEASRERIARWGFRQDVAGLLEALECVVGQRSVS